MTVHSSPALARTDVQSPQPGPAPLVGATEAPGIRARTVRRLGAGLTAGALAWATANAIFTTTPADDPGIAITDLTGLGFQLGVFCLLTVQLRTRATGLGRGAVGLLRVEYVLLGLAALWSLLHGVAPALRDETWLAVLDVFWPLSMLGMFVIGIKVALAGRWRGLARVWPLVAESWAVVTVPSFAIFGAGVASIVGSVHLVIGYAVLGLILLRRPDLVGAGD